MTIPNARQYIVQQVLTPSGAGLSVGAVLLAIRNTAVAPAPLGLALKAVISQVLFTGTAAASGSLFGLQKVTATPTGGTVITPFRANTGADVASVDARFSNTGLATVTANGASFGHFGHGSQVGATTPPDLTWDDENPVFFLPGECLIVYAHNTLVLGINCSIHIRWFQVT